LLSYYSNKNIPSYPNRFSFVPLTPEDYGDGGAYPEIHMIQYPLNMGKPGQKQSSALIPVQVDEQGTIRTDLIVKQGSNKNKLIQSTMSDIKAKKLTREEVALPNEQEELETAERTKKQLEMILEGKIKSTKPTTLATAATETNEPTYIRYTPNPNAPG
jgi:SNW domain-containing protein 1